MQDRSSFLFYYILFIILNLALFYQRVYYQRIIKYSVGAMFGIINPPIVMCKCYLLKVVTSKINERRMICNINLQASECLD